MSLNHPNIAAIHGIDETDGSLALIMDLVEGEDLSALIARGRLALSDTLPLARQIADALEAARPCPSTGAQGTPSKVEGSRRWA